MLEIDEDSPGVRIPPPFVVLAAVIIAFVLRVLAPAPVLSETVRWISGVPLFLIGAFLMLWSVKHFKKFKTNIQPWKTTLAIIKEGPYRFSRNPIYISFLLIVLGAVCMANNLYAVVLVVLVYFFLRYYVIPKEEGYLEGKFENDYRMFRDSTHRWL